MSVTRLIALCFTLCIAACNRSSETQGIDESIDRVVDAARARDASALVSVLADDFIGNGKIGKAELESHLRDQFAAIKAVSVRLGTISLEPQGDRATVRFDAYVTDEASGQWIPGRAATVRFETGWRREDGRWLCTNARWSSDSRWWSDSR